MGLPKIFGFGNAKSAGCLMHLADTLGLKPFLTRREL
jgi:hypothetical protein